jgi:enolase
MRATALSGRAGNEQPLRFRQERHRSSAKSLVHSRKGTTQITATQSVDTDDETLAVLSVSCDWQIKTAGDARTGQMNEEKLRRLELIRAAAEGRK